MVQFSSKPPFNDDPEPYVSGVGNRHATNFNPSIWTREPRPEYNRPQHNPTNPILTKLRSLKEVHRHSWVDGFLDQASHVRFPNWTDAETDHAVKVLTRGKAVFG